VFRISGRSKEETACIVRPTNLGNSRIHIWQVQGGADVVQIRTEIERDLGPFLCVTVPVLRAIVYCSTSISHPKLSHPIEPSMEETRTVRGYGQSRRVDLY
jgi:hypothetical protein